MNFLNIKTDDDIIKLANLASEIWHEYWPCLLSNEQIDYMVEKFQSFEALKNQIENDKYTYNIFEDNGNITGYFGICPKQDYMFLSKLYVKKDYRHMGIGKLALKKIIQFSLQYNKKYIKLTVNKNNINTINAYKNWGFQTIDATVSDIGQGFVMDDYIMKLDLI